MKKISLFLILFSLLLGTFSWAEARVYLDITAADFRKMPVAVPYFINKSKPGQPEETGRDMADLLSRGLEFHGFITVVPASSYGGGQDADWRSLAVDFSVLGQYQTSAEGLTMELKLLNVLDGQTIFAKRYSGTVQKRKGMVLKFCDEIIQQLSGEPGVSLTKIAFASDATGYKEIYIADPLGEEVRQVTKHNRLAISPRFSPNARLLAYTSYHPGNPNLYITDLSQSKITKAISTKGGLNLAPAFSPDGKTMVVTLSKDGNPDLYLMDTQGQILRRLTTNAGLNVSPSFSPDGTKLAFVSDRSGRPHVYIMDMQSNNVTRLTFQGSDNSEPSWSPKGDWIAYSGLEGGIYQLFIIRPEGGLPTRVTSNSGNHESPTWSPDGRQIAFTWKRSNSDQQICAIFKNGTGLRTLFKLKGKQSYPQWSTWITP